MKKIRIEPITKIKFRIYLDEQFAFVLYKTELSRYKLKDEMEIEKSTVDRILEEAVLKRAKQKAMKLLQDADRTKNELRERLIRAEFPEEITDKAISYVESFGYLDDKRYVENFVLSKKGRKSRKEIYAELYRKKVDMELVDSILEDRYEEEDTQEAIRKILEKKKYRFSEATTQEKNKICSYLARKGFGYGDIRKAMEIQEWFE